MVAQCSDRPPLQVPYRILGLSGKTGDLPIGQFLNKFEGNDFPLLVAQAADGAADRAGGILPFALMRQIGPIIFD